MQTRKTDESVQRNQVTKLVDSTAMREISSPAIQPKNSQRGSRVLFALFVVSLSGVLSSCAKSMPQNALAPEGEFAEKTHRLFVPVAGIAGVVFVLVQGLIVVAVLKYRRRDDAEAPKQIHGNAKMEIGWTITPALILLVVGVFTIGTVADLSHRPAKADNPLQVKVIGHQWWWEYIYDTNANGRFDDADVHTANTLVMPTARPVDIHLTSEDVEHNFWVPKLAGKIYAIPGRINHLTLQAKLVKEYRGQCSEFCGLSHANMRVRVQTMKETDFESWLEAQRQGPVNAVGAAASSGRLLFVQKGCSGCHSITGIAKGKVGPNLTHLQSRHVFAGALFPLDDANLRRWLRNPPAEKPGSKMPNLGLTENEITDLISYLDTLE